MNREYFPYEQRYHSKHNFDISTVAQEKLQIEAESGQFKERLLKDFRLSFRFSLGSAKAQHILVYLLGMQYFQAEKIVRNATLENLPLITEAEWRAAARPPKQHSRESESHLEREGRAEWERFQTHTSPLFIANEIMTTELAEDYGNLLLQFTHIMISRDTVQIHQGRPMRTSSKKATMSFVREYALANLSTGSPTFDALFYDMQRIILTYPPSELEHLATLWQQRHPNEEFYTSDFMERAKEAGTKKLFAYRPGVDYFDKDLGRREFVPVLAPGLQN